MTFVLRSCKMLFVLASARCEGLAASGSADETQLICVMDTTVCRRTDLCRCGECALGILEGTHHRAGDDAEMCAKLYLREIRDGKLCNLNEFDNEHI